MLGPANFDQLRAVFHERLACPTNGRVGSTSGRQLAGLEITHFYRGETLRLAQ
jgi:hypothetical protein